MGDRLTRYRDKRRPGSTKEPGVHGTGPAKRARGRTLPKFVIQKHDASRLHYDLRLEVDGTLRSWAVPKGPSTDPREKRLAVEVEDHPLEYADFEGVIDEGNYGAGAVIVWDAGTYRNLDEERSMAEARTGRQAQWLLIKRRDEEADARRNPQSTQPESVKSGRTVEQVAREAAARRK
jgi:DNA ligase D-like protein (predicted 3'-phosphoesterase)